MAVVLLREVIERFQTWAIAHLASGTVQNYRRHLLRFLDHVGNVDCATLRAFHLIEWSKTWHETVSVQRAFNWAATYAEILPANPFANVKRQHLGKRRRIFTPAELVKVLRTAGTDFRGYLLALRETIARPQEIRAVRWEWIRSTDAAAAADESLRNGTSYFVLDEYKSRTRRTDPDAKRIIPITQRLGRFLVRLRQRSADDVGIIFRAKHGRTWTKEAVRLRMKRARTKAGIVADARGETLCCYSIRHTAATLAVTRGLRDRTLADLMGHTSTRTTARYQHLQVTHLMDAFRQASQQRRKRLA